MSTNTINNLFTTSIELPSDPIETLPAIEMPSEPDESLPGIELPSDPEDEDSFPPIELPSDPEPSPYDHNNTIDDFPEDYVATFSDQVALLDFGKIPHTGYHTECLCPEHFGETCITLAKNTVIDPALLLSNFEVVYCIYTDPTSTTSPKITYTNELPNPLPSHSSFLAKIFKKDFENDPN